MPDQKTTLAGIRIKIMTPPGISDQIEPVIIEHEPVKKTGARLEPMGLKARKVSFSAYFKGDSWADHLKLLAEIEKQELVDFIHPKYGLMRGMVNIFSLSQDNIERQATLDITFVEDLVSASRPVYRENVTEAVKAHVATVNDQAISQTKTGIDTTLGESGIGIADQIIDFNNSVIGEFPDVTGQVRHYLKEVDRLVTSMETTLTLITNPTNTFIAALDFGTTLPGRMVKAVTQLAERVVILIEDLGDAPENFVDSYRDQMLILEETLSIDDGTLGGTTSGSTLQKQYERSAKLETQKIFRAMGAAVAASKLADIYDDDNVKRRQIQQQEQAETFDALGNYLGGPFQQQEIMTVQEIEAALYTAREYIQQAIDINRELTALHDIALSLVRDVNEIKLQLEQVTTITETGTDPLFIIMLRQGLPYKMIDRIIPLNPEKPDPNNYTGEMNLYAA